MAREHEMVSSEASIPIRILARDGSNIINDSALKDGLVAHGWIKQVLDDHHDAEGKEVDVGLVGVPCLETARMLGFHEAEEHSFH